MNPIHIEEYNHNLFESEQSLSWIQWIQWIQWTREGITGCKVIRP